MRNKRRRVPIFKREEDTDPLSVVVNLFDVAMVFAVALMVAMVMNMTEVFSKEDFTVVKNPGKDNMEIISKKGNKIEKYTPSADQNNSQNKTKGKKVGTAYQLEDGQIIYIED